MPALLEGQTLTAMFHGRAKSGKSNLGASLPKPLLYLDVEMGSHFLPLKSVEWKDSRSPIPKSDGTWDTCVLRVRSWDDARRALEMLTTRAHPFKGVTVDSVAALQNRIIADIAGVQAVEIQEWGEILRLLQSFCENLRDLTQHPKHPLQAVCVICPTKLMGPKDQETWQPHLRGQMSSVIPYLFDLNGFLYTKGKLVDGKLVETRYLRTRRTEGKGGIEAGERVGGTIPEVFELPQITGTREEVIKKNVTFQLLMRRVYANHAVAIAAPASNTVPPPPADNPSTINEGDSNG